MNIINCKNHLGFSGQVDSIQGEFQNQNFDCPKQRQVVEMRFVLPPKSNNVGALCCSGLNCAVRTSQYPETKKC